MGHFVLPLIYERGMHISLLKYRCNSKQQLFIFITCNRILRHIKLLILYTIEFELSDYVKLSTKNISYIISINCIRNMNNLVFKSIRKKLKATIFYNRINTLTPE